MKEGERFGRILPNYEDTTKNSVGFDGEKWELHFESGEEMEIPQQLGKVMSLGMNVTDLAITKENNLPKERIEKFDCHIFLGLGLGCISLSDLLKSPLLEESFDKRMTGIALFDNTEHRFIETVDDFNALVRKKLENEKVGVLQFKDSNMILQHSSFVFETDQKIYVGHKSGFEGIVVFGASEEVIPGCLEVHGHNIAAAPYKFFAGNKTLKEDYSRLINKT